MFIELVDSLRCLADHEETWLVAAVTRMDGRHIVDGILGCPICKREYRVVDGVAWFTTSGEPSPAGLTPPGGPAHEDLVLRAAALMGLTDAGGIVCVGGPWVACADALAELGPAHVVTLTAQARPSGAGAEAVSALVVDDRLPFGTGAVRAVALGAELATGALVRSAVSVLRSRGRLVAPADSGVPDGVTELARDETDWVAERVAVASMPVALRSARR